MSPARRRDLLEADGMFCAVCLSVKGAKHPEREPVNRSEGALDRLTCEGCGRNLDGDLVDRLAAKVTQLSRFGLTGRPLLSRRRP